MPDSADELPEPVPGHLRDPDLSILRDHFREMTRWVIGEAVGDQLTAAQCDALADELAVILSSGLAPALQREIEHQTEKTIASLQHGPVSFNHDHQLTVDGWTAPDLVKLLDAVGRLVDTGIPEPIFSLHETHRHTLYRARDHWLAKQEQAEPAEDKT